MYQNYQQVSRASMNEGPILTPQRQVIILVTATKLLGTVLTFVIPKCKTRLAFPSGVSQLPHALNKYEAIFAFICGFCCKFLQFL